MKCSVTAIGCIGSAYSCAAKSKVGVLTSLVLESLSITIGMLALTHVLPGIGTFHASLITGGGVFFLLLSATLLCSQLMKPAKKSQQETKVESLPPSLNEDETPDIVETPPFQISEDIVLPDEILVELFSHLSLRDIKAFKCVCKNWNLVGSCANQLLPSNLMRAETWLAKKQYGGSLTCHFELEIKDKLVCGIETTEDLIIKAYPDEVILYNKNNQDEIRRIKKQDIKIDGQVWPPQNSPLKEADVIRQIVCHASNLYVRTDFSVQIFKLETGQWIQTIFEKNTLNLPNRVENFCVLDSCLIVHFLKDCYLDVMLVYKTSSGEFLGKLDKPTAFNQIYPIDQERVLIAPKNGFFSEIWHPKSQTLLKTLQGGPVCIQPSFFDGKMFLFTHKVEIYDAENINKIDEFSIDKSHNDYSFTPLHFFSWNSTPYVLAKSEKTKNRCFLQLWNLKSKTLEMQSEFKEYESFTFMTDGILAFKTGDALDFYFFHTDSYYICSLKNVKRILHLDRDHLYLESTDQKIQAYAFR